MAGPCNVLFLCTGNSARSILAEAILQREGQGLSSITVPWATLLLSVLLYIVMPVAAAQCLRRLMLACGGEAALRKLLGVLQPSALIGASNFFELAVAAAISLFGLKSGAALATVAA